MPTVTTSSKGQIVLPRAIREHYRILKGTRIEIIDLGGGVIALVPIMNGCIIRHMIGMFQGEKSVQDILQQGREEDERHEKSLPSRNKT